MHICCAEMVEAQLHNQNIIMFYYYVQHTNIHLTLVYKILN